MAEPCVSVRIDHLRCRICGDVLRNPVTLPCGHNFCMRCVVDRWDRGDGVGCPGCGCSFASRPQLIMNTALAEMARDTGRCDNGGGASPRRPKRRWSSTESSSCAAHDRPLDAYCCTDELLLCEACASAEHRGHRIGCVKLERRRKQEELEIIQGRSRQILHQEERKCEHLGGILQQIEAEAARTEDRCEIAVSSAIDSLQRHYMSVKKRIAAQAQEATAQVLASLQTMEARIKGMKERDAELDCLAQTESDVRFLQEWPALRLLCEKDHRHEVLKEPLLPFEFTKRAVEDLARQLEEICDKEFSSISQTADSGEQQEPVGESKEEDTEEECETNISLSLDSPGATSARAEQNVEPTTRAQFLQYACELTLDAATAHDDLVVSAGGKEVKLSPQINKTSSIRTSERFLHRRQLLCREGLHAERCYYEVEVEGDKAEIALAYKQINRKSRSKLSAFGGNANSWSLDRSKMYSVSHNGNSVELTTAPSHARIGVYLKFREGTLSFYEVSDSMSMKFLYKDEAKFTESLFPGFWLGDKCRIRICNLRQ